MTDPNTYPTIDQTIGRTPLVRLQRIGQAARDARGNVILGKLEGNNPAGSVKDRPALAMIQRAQARGEIRPGDTLIEATSGNTGIALAMAAAILGYRMVLIMPDNLSVERRQSMKAYGAELILVTREQGMEGARDLADRMQSEGRGRVLDQFANDDNWAAHYETTGPEIWQDTHGRITHFVSAMGTTGTITGVSRYLKERNPAIQIVGAQPEEGSSIPGIRKWPEAYLPKIYRHAIVDRLEYVSQHDAETMARRLAAEEGLFCGPSAAGACCIAQRVSDEVRDATIVFVVCDRGDRYLSMGLFPGVIPPIQARMSGTLRGILYVAASGLSFSLLDSLAKFLCRTYPSEMVAWARYFFHVLVMLVVLWPAWRGRLVTTRRPLLQVLRGSALGLSSVTFFAGLALMPQAEATAIVAVGPIIVTVVAVVWLGERAPSGTWWALAASFLGVLLIIRPGSSVFTPAVLLPLATAGFGAAYTLLTRKLAGVDDSVATLFIGAVVPTVMLSGLMPLYWKPVESAWHWLGLVGLGAIGAGGHLLVVRAYETASASALAPFGYTHAVASIPMGLLVFGTFPDRPALLGMLMIVATGVVMALLRGNERR